GARGPAPGAQSGRRPRRAAECPLVLAHRLAPVPAQRDRRCLARRSARALRGGGPRPGDRPPRPERGQHPAAPRRAVGGAPPRHRRERPRRPLPADRRLAGLDHRRPRRDGDRGQHRRPGREPGRLPRSLGRRRPDALHRRDDGDPLLLPGPDRRRRLRLVVPQHRHGDRRHQLDGGRPDRPRGRPPLPQLRVRRRRPGARRLRSAGPVPPHPAPHRSVHPRRGDARRRQRDPARVGAELPRPGDPAAPGELGQHAQQRPGLPLGQPQTADVPGAAHPRHRAGLQLPGRRAARRPRPAGPRGRSV
ncbi:MAG: Dipeptide transport system permease protein DppC, partial [uncultured Thermomicrobiales bacterium]